MSLLQSRRRFKTAAAIAALVSVAFLQPAWAEETDDSPPRQPLFACGTDPEADEGFLDLSGIELGFAEWDDLRFERTANLSGETIYSFPPEGTDYKTAFLFSHSNGEDGYLVSIRWVDAGTNYVYYSLDVPPDPDVEDDMGGGEAGLVISRDGKLIERVACHERPYMFISYLREHTSCDTRNPYGLAACEEGGAERTTPLDVNTIGIVP